MTQGIDARQFQARLQRLEALLAEAERRADPTAQDRTREIVQAVLELHAAGLTRVVEHLAGAGEAGRAILDACAADEVVSGLLLLHGLHPNDLEARIGQALEQVRPALARHGGSVELLSVSGGTVRLRLLGNCEGCGSSAATMKQTIEAAILAKAPDVTAIEVEGLAALSVQREEARLALPLV